MRAIKNKKYQNSTAFNCAPQIFIFFQVLTFAVAMVIFSIILVKGYHTDLDAHIAILEKHLQVEAFPVPPLYYFALYLMQLFMDTNYMINTVLILSIAVVWKFSIANQYLINQLKGKPFPGLVISLLIFSLLFFFPIYVAGIDGSKLYLGKFTPTIWHNSTTVFVFPFALLLYFQSLKYIKRPNSKYLIYLFLLGFLILISKPNFIFVFLPSFLIIYVLKNRTMDIHLFHVIVLCLFLFLGIILLKWMIYASGEIDNLFYGGEKTNILIDPFGVWLNWTDNPLFDLASSFLFPILFLFFYYKRLIKDLHFQFALLLVFMGLIVFWTFAESGERFAHGNFYWQIPICLFILYLVLVKHLFQMLEIKTTIGNTIKSMSKSVFILLFVFGLHVSSGGIYLFKLLYFGSFS